MVTLVIPEEKLLGFANAYMNEELREVMFFLQDGPMTQESMTEILKVKEDVLVKRLDRLRELGLVRRIISTDSRLDLYALELSLERFGGYPKRKTTKMLSDAMCEPIVPFLEANSQEIGALCETYGMSVGRAIEQLLLSSFSKIIEDYKAEIVEEDKMISKKFKVKK
jgi:DNA-binding Lrp family transcriptional regulator